jgi:hypothetical protein
MPIRIRRERPDDEPILILTPMAVRGLVICPPFFPGRPSA